ncbi:bile acid:sodium symporter family protein [Alicyclobacillus dauci]|uniref:Bile acid:sodium symporter family protein n=1 Tax=Alicyclobacillus dauci TaxID=1475485 RepID=A0ABY6Z8W6_9BACL|nr:bile acid:sodium symporter family protein [Alicyclobacillus dauci]WAH39272.1 bile acid:sodium symporter family protein [Alicyclobacillus dauci]WAH39464.1 bile acid:sodium symporter family protein [Alicyclobacillus dauci]
MKTLEAISRFVGSTFAYWVLLFAIVAFIAPHDFVWIGKYTVELLGVVMFGMGLTLSPADFKEVFRRPKDVAIGVVSHFVVMPLLAFLICLALRLPSDIAVGVILVGSCPSGTSSNVMTFLARGDVSLAVSIASVSTILAPIVTPALILLFASKWVAVNPVSLFWQIVQVIIIPIIIGLIVKSIFRGTAKTTSKILPLVSAIAIVAIVAGVVSGSHKQIAATGLLIFLAVVLHNVCGFALGYLLAKITGMELPKRAAVSLEVGMQNSALGVAIAKAHFTPIAAVPSAIFSVWHNISGAILASIYRGMNQRRQERAGHADSSGTLDV